MLITFNTKPLKQYLYNLRLQQRVGNVIHGTVPDRNRGLKNQLHVFSAREIIAMFTEISKILLKQKRNKWNLSCKFISNWSQRMVIFN